MNTLRARLFDNGPHLPRGSLYPSRADFEAQVFDLVFYETHICEVAHIILLPGDGLEPTEDVPSVPASSD